MLAISGRGIFERKPVCSKPIATNMLKAVGSECMIWHCHPAPFNSCNLVSDGKRRLRELHTASYSDS
jgi:hypothetical protein